MANDEGGESFDAEVVGSAKVVYEDTVGDTDYLFIEVILFVSFSKYVVNVKNYLLYCASSWAKRLCPRRD